jgi:hypothetical protein
MTREGKGEKLNLQHDAANGPQKKPLLTQQLVQFHSSLSRPKTQNYVLISTIIRVARTVTGIRLILLRKYPQQRSAKYDKHSPDEGTWESDLLLLDINILAHITIE